MSTRNRILPIVMAAGFFMGLFIVMGGKPSLAFELRDMAAIGAAYTTHLFFHEVGHQVMANEVGADSSHMKFFTVKEGKFYPGVSTCKKIPEESKVPYAFGGERMAGYTFEYALDSYKRKQTTFNKALMFFTCTDFVIYTFMGNYISPNDETYDPNIIREESGCSKELLLSLVMARSLSNAYRIYKEDTNFIPMIMLDKTSASLVFRFDF